MLNIILMAPPQGGQGNPLMQMLPLILIIVVFYFFMIRPQMKKAKEQKKLVESLKKGDRILTIGGIYGKVVETDETTVLMETEDGSRMRVVKSAITAEGIENSNK
ncbi:MAG TPA: preprotein translocase subunit YajC [Bacteroidia bacterium]|jgi:preprotein translocase subunit YajC|nr:preprotein translocase subunit YajC [Bacteroidia bacterium]